MWLSVISQENEGMGKLRDLHTFMREIKTSAEQGLLCVNTVYSSFYVFLSGKIKAVTNVGCPHLTNPYKLYNESWYNLN